MGNHIVQTADLLDLQAEEKSIDSFDPFFSLEANDSSASASRLATAAAPPTLPPPPLGGSAQFSAPGPVKSNFNFPEKFSDAAGTHATSRFSPLMPPPTKTSKLKADSSTISHYSTIRPRKKSAKDDFSTLSRPFKSPNQSFSETRETRESKASGPTFQTQHSFNTLFYSKSQTSSSEKRASPVPESLASSFNSCAPGDTKDKFDCAPFIAKAKEPVDLFTELDPLNAGSARPYLNKQYFFQDLKKPSNSSNASGGMPESTLKEVERSPRVHGRRRSPSENQPVNYQPVADFQASLFDAHFSFDEPKKDPFDTNFVSSVSLSTAMSSHQEPAVTFPASTTAFSSVGYENSKAISFSVESCAENIAFHSDFTSQQVSKPSSPRPTIALQSFGTLETAQKKSSTSIGNLAHKSQSEVNSFTIEESAAVQATWKVANEPVVPELPVKDAVSPLATRRFSENSSSSEESADFQAFPSKEEHPWEQQNGHGGENQSFFTSTHSDDVVARVSSPPQPPPRPPVLRPPPLPPKGQPPNVPQRSISAASEESATPPLPVPMRKAKHVTSAKPAIQSALKARGQADDGEIKQRPAQAPKSQPDINNISLLQLSNMSLSDLAATLKLPPVRIASMTLTELALRLNELNRVGNQEPINKDNSTNSVEDASQKEYYGLPKRNQRLSERSLEEQEDDEKDYEEEFEEDDDDEEEEEEEQVSENKLEDAEVCYKGGKKYEMLSDIHDHEEELHMSNKKLIEPGGTPPPKCESATSTTSDSDRYAALREIMEQDLASNRTFQPENASVNFDADVKFANFESAADVFKESQLEPPDELPAQDQPAALGFEDDFNNLTVKIPQIDPPQLNDTFHESSMSMSSKPKASTPEAFESKVVLGGDSAFDSDFNDVIHSSIPATGVQNDLFAHSQSESECDELAKKFAAFEARFPLNPVSGFADSFVDMERSQPNVATKHVLSKAEEVAPFDVDFDSAFQEKQDTLESFNACQQLAVKKSTSVNIFRRVEDPFDDDFFQPASNTTLPSAPKPTSSNIFATIVEDPFVWVQPFDDGATFEDSSEAFS